MRIERLVREIPDALLDCRDVDLPADEADFWDRWLDEITDEHARCVELARIARRLQEELRDADP